MMLATCCCRQHLEWLKGEATLIHSLSTAKDWAGGTAIASTPCFQNPNPRLHPNPRFQQEPEQVSPRLYPSCYQPQEWVVGPAPSRSSTEPQHNMRWLPQMARTELYQTYTQMCEGQPASMTTFTRVWLERKLDERIKFRPIGTHSACATCTQLREWGAQARSEEDKQKVDAHFAEHRTIIMMDRACDMRLEEVALRCMSGSAGVLPRDQHHGSLVIDGMEQAKFRMPRCECGS